MQLSQVLAAAAIAPDRAEYIAPHWDATQARMPAVVAELQPAAWQPARVAVGLAAALEGDLTRAARRIEGDEALRRLFWHYLQLVYELPRGPNLSRWPRLTEALGDDAGLFYLLVALASVPKVQALHARQGIPPNITQDTIQQVRLFCDEMHRRGTGGRPGAFVNQVYWFRNYTDGLLYRLGRMEYMVRPAGGAVEVWRHRRTGYTQALLSAGQHVTPEGFLISGEEASAQAECVTSELTRDASAVRGLPVSPLGFAERRPCSLALAQWEKVFGPGDPILEMHIPAGGSMPPEACVQSLRAGFEFFPRYFPDRRPRACTCQSWIFNTQLFELLPADANLNKLMREVYLYPVVSGPRSGLFFIFFDENVEIDKAPETTSVQRAVKQFLLAGNRFRSGGMFFLQDDLARFGRQHYRSQGARPE